MKKDRSSLSDYLVGELDPQSRHNLEAHLRTDSSLREEFEKMRELDLVLRDAFDADLHAFSAGELANLRKKMGLAPLGGSKVVSGQRKALHSVFWGAVAAACVALMFLLGQTLLNENLDGTGGGRTAAGGGVIYYTPTTLSPNPGEELRILREAEEMKVISDNGTPRAFAPLRSPELTRINRSTRFHLPPIRSLGSYERLKQALLHHERLPRPEEIRISELGAQLADSSFSIELIEHPWAKGMQILQVSSGTKRLTTGKTEKSYTLELGGGGSVRLFGEQVPVAEGRELSPSRFESVSGSEYQQWWIEGKLSELEVQFYVADAGGVQSLRLPSERQGTRFEELSSRGQASLVLLGLGEFLRGSNAAPQPEQLLAMCEVLRSRSKLSAEALEPAVLVEAALKLKQAESTSD